MEKKFLRLKQIIPNGSQELAFFFFFKYFYVMVICLVSLRDQVFNAKIVVMYCKVFNIYQSKVEDTYRRSKKEKVMVGRGTWNTIIQFLLLIN